MYKASSGAIEYTNIFQVSNINSTLKNLREKIFGFTVLMVMVIKISLTSDWKGNNILLFGSEGFGMHQHTSKYADFFVKIDINRKLKA